MPLTFFENTWQRQSNKDKALVRGEIMVEREPRDKWWYAGLKHNHQVLPSEAVVDALGISYEVLAEDQEAALLLANKKRNQKC